ncbi:hypothetical protein [Rhizobium sp. 007]|uniref:hypothetical protein n=1 Tax=Rhizobium sp. 007 TaxID=2785056 RepID=UPI00188ED564|nr:hypothetical protein [Rhizobium sp. 007]QPB21339.1 hypothetical protein ISN39_07810 [Rhizobium sp. 007]
MSLTDEMMKQFGVDALTKPMTKGEAYQLLDALKSVLLEHKGRLDALEASGIKYCGTWQRALPYRKGMVVTSAGSMWTARYKRKRVDFHQRSGGDHDEEGGRGYPKAWIYPF